MYKLIKKVQKHPEHIRERITIVITASITFVIFAAWVVTLDSRLPSYGGASGNTAAVLESSKGLTVISGVEESEPEAASPTSFFSRKLDETYEGFKEAVGL